MLLPTGGYVIGDSFRHGGFPDPPRAGGGFMGKYGWPEDNQLSTEKCADMLGCGELALTCVSGQAIGVATFGKKLRLIGHFQQKIEPIWGLECGKTGRGSAHDPLKPGFWENNNVVRSSQGLNFFFVRLNLRKYGAVVGYRGLTQKL